jgi:capsid protein
MAGTRFPKIEALDLRPQRVREDSATLGHPDASPFTGRFPKRSGASLQGTLSNWVHHLVQSRMAEREKRRIADRSLDLYANDAMSRGILDSFPVDVVGTGLTPQSQPMAEWLGFDLEWRQEFQSRAYMLFELWGLDARNFCDAQRRLNIYMLQALAVFMWKLEGVGLFQLVRKPTPWAPLDLAVLPINPARLVTPSDRQNENIYDGLELDDDGAIVAGWIMRPNRNGMLSSSARSDQCARIPAVDEATGLPRLLTVCDVKNVSDYRQDSALGCMIKEIRDNNDFVDAALVKALIANLFTVFIENAFGGAQRQDIDWRDRVQELEKGTILLGSLEEKPHIIQDSDTPGPSYEIMNSSIVGRLGMATGRGPENVSKAYKASYSASQASIENAGKWDDVDRMVLVNRFCQPVHARMLHEAAARGLLPARSMAHFTKNLHAYTRTEWLPPKLRPIDKQKAANADDTRLRNGTRTFSDIYGEQSRDWQGGIRQWIHEIAFIKAEAEKAGLTLEEVLGSRFGKSGSSRSGDSSGQDAEE